MVTPVVVVAISCALRDTQHTLHPSNDATCYSTRRPTDDRADGTGRAVSYRGALSRAPPDALRLGGNRRHENGKDGGKLQDSECHDFSPLEIATIIPAIVGKVPVVGRGPVLEQIGRSLR
jgi:hypothetical protein